MLKRDSARLRDRMLVVAGMEVRAWIAVQSSSSLEKPSQPAAVPDQLVFVSWCLPRNPVVSTVDMVK